MATVDDKVFVSYCDRDEPWLDELLAKLLGLSAMERPHVLSRRQLCASATAHSELHAILRRTRVAVLLVSSQYLKDDWVRRHELGPILALARANQLELLWLLLEPTPWEKTELASYPPALPADQALSLLVDEEPRARAWANLCDTIQRRLAGISRQRASLSQAPQQWISKLPTQNDSGVFEGRGRELAFLDWAWADPQTRIVSLVAIGGTGKSTLAARWVHRMLEKTHSAVARYFDWSFYSQGTLMLGGNHATGSADEFLNAALNFFRPLGYQGDLPSSRWDKGARLAQWIAQERTLLVLDGLEPLQHSPGPLGGKLIDEALVALLRQLASHNPGLCVITTREHVADLKVWLDRGVKEWKLDQLDDRAGSVLLRRLGVLGTKSDLEKASREVKGHALTLSLMGRYLKLVFDPPEISRRDCFKFAPADLELQNGHAFRVFAAYERWLAREGRKEELAVLLLLGLFDRPATPDCIAALGRPPIVGLTDVLAKLSDMQWNLVLAHLTELDLIQMTPWKQGTVLGYSEDAAKQEMAARQHTVNFALGDPEPFVNQLPLSGNRQRVLDAHPLLREYCAKRLRDQSPLLWQSAHARLYEHLCSSVPYWPVGEEGLQPLYQAVVHGCLAGLYEETCAKVYRDRIMRRDLFYSTQRLGLIGADLSAVTCFFTEPWLKLVPGLPDEVQAWLSAVAAFCLRALNRLAEARAPMLAAVKIIANKEDWNGAAAAASNLSELELSLGAVTAAVQLGAQAVAFAERSGDELQGIHSRITHADALHQAGQAEASQALFVIAESMHARQQQRYPFLFAVHGFRYCDLLLAAAERSAWQHVLAILTGLAPPTPPPAATSDALAAIASRAGQLIKWRQPDDSLLGIALEELTLGRVHLYLAVMSATSFPLTSEASVAARAHLHTAIGKLRESGNQDELPRGLLSGAWLHAVEGEDQLARGLLAEAEALAERGGLRLLLADVHLHRARLLFPTGLAAARKDLAKGRALIVQTAYLRRVPEHKDFEVILNKAIPLISPVHSTNERTLAKWQQQELNRKFAPRRVSQQEMSRSDQSMPVVTIGLITALEKEYVAMKALLLDPREHHVPGAGAGRRYLLGRIPLLHGGELHVALTITDPGNNIAATRATLLLEHFPSVDFVVMVGIAGGIPHLNDSEHHVRLGDIVVSDKKGVVQYDMLKLAEVRASPIAPSSLLLEAVRWLRSSELEGCRPWDAHIEAVLRRLKQERPVPQTDRLYRSDHPAELCTHPIDPKRVLGLPRVFLGPVASANTLQKDPVKRDLLRTTFGAKAVEMEGSGVADATWNHGKGYLVIRGICDYCDSHKNDLWQEYAAAAAAGYARALLETLPQAARGDQ